MTLEMTLNCPQISAAGFFKIGFNLIPMVNLIITAVLLVIENITSN